MAVKGISNIWIITCKEKVSMARSKGSTSFPGKDIPARDGFPCKIWVSREDYFCEVSVSLQKVGFLSKEGYPCQGRVFLQGMGFPVMERL